MKDFCIEQSGDTDLLKIGEILGSGDVNIYGLCTVNFDGHRIIHFAVDDCHTAKTLLEQSGFHIKEISDVFIFDKDSMEVTGKPGSFGEICKTFIAHGIQINFGYPAENNRYIFGLSDVKKAYELMK